MVAHAAAVGPVRAGSTPARADQCISAPNPETRHSKPRPPPTHRAAGPSSSARGSPGGQRSQDGRTVGEK